MQANRPFESVLFFVIAFAVAAGCHHDDSAALGQKAAVTVGKGEGGVVSFEGCAGTVAEENGAPVTLAGNVTWSLGRVGCGLDFNGQGAVDLGRSYLSAAKSFSVAAWVDLADAAAASTIVSAPGRLQSGFALRYTGADADGRPGHLALTSTSQDQRQAKATSVEGNIALLPGRWTHVAATFDAKTNTARLYVDGAFAGSGILPTGIETDGATLVGALWQDGLLTNNFNGRIDELVMHPGVYTDADVQTLVAQGPVSTPLRAPATPLVVRDPYMSSWQMHDPNGRDWTHFWTGAVRALFLMARVDGQTYQLMGAGALPGTTLASEVQREVTPTETRASFVAGAVGVHVTFASDMDLSSAARLSAPLGSIVVQAQSRDGNAHDVKLYADTSAEWVLPDANAQVQWALIENKTYATPYAAYHVTPSQATAVSELNDAQTWGEQWWAASGPSLSTQSGQDIIVRQAFAAGTALSNAQDTAQPRAIKDRWPVFAFSFALGNVTGASSDPVTFTLGQVRQPAMTYGNQSLQPWWTTQWPTSGAMLVDVHTKAATFGTRAQNLTLDRQIWRDAVAAGGPRYASLCALSFRQLFGGLQFVRYGNALWAFLKEISSDGNISTVDVLYPSMPLLAYLQPSLLKDLLVPIFAYSESGNWPQPFAPHDLGASFPNATLHNDGGGENMPIEESANMILMVATYAKMQNDATSTSFVAQHYPVLAQWANYLVDNTLDPEYQNQTDDFTGFIEHSSNLALKGILALGAMSQLATIANKPADASHYASVATDYIAKWGQMSLSDNKTHLKLQYDVDASWSQKYNMFVDKLLGLDLVPEATYQLEANVYKAKMNDFGVPLDSRHTYTKLDWSLWTAGATEDPELKRAIIDSAYRYANETSSRVPMSDWYETETGSSVAFVARPVVGGVYSLLARARAGH